MINDLLINYKNVAEKLNAELLAVREQLAAAEEFNAYLLDRIDHKDAIIEDLQDEIDVKDEIIDNLGAEIEELESECDALVLERAQMYEIERKAWAEWQKLKKENNY